MFFFINELVYASFLRNPKENQTLKKCIRYLASIQTNGSLTIGVTAIQSTQEIAIVIVGNEQKLVLKVCLSVQTDQ